MEENTFNRLTENGLYLTVKDVIALQNTGFAEITVDLTREPASYALTFGEWLKLSQGAIKVTLARQAAFTHLKIKSVRFDYTQPFKCLSIPRKITIEIWNKVAVV